MALADFSRFALTERLIQDGKETYGTWQQFPFLLERPNDDQIGAYMVTSQTEGRPDLIANALYGSALLDWVLLAFNNVIETLNWPRAGEVIEYPLEAVLLPQLI